jgi:hypothetical protein
VNRRFLGRYNDVVTRHAVYMTDSAIEIDERDIFSVVRKRVFFEDVLLVTLHDRIAILQIFVSLGFAFFLGMIGLIAGGMAGGITALCGLPLLIYGVLLIRIRESIITIFGRRSRARIRFTLRRAHARRLYEELCAQARRMQNEMNPPAEEDRSSERREEPWLTSSNLLPPQ